MTCFLRPHLNIQQCRLLTVVMLLLWAIMILACGGAGKNTAKDIQNRQQSDSTSEVSRIPSTEVAQHGDIRVKILAAAVRQVPLNDFSVSRDNLLMITLQLTNVNPKRIVTYRSWGGWGRILHPNSERAGLKDDIGNSYALIKFNLGAYPLGAVNEKSESIYSDKPISDILVFERPVAAAKYLDLNLPAKNFGETGEIRFRISMDHVRR
ncbi:MAG: hypothetical protein RMJ88_16010 [Thermogemmata sp.]|nr:hypothetical protein [Thermogemmata sp.]